jgi:hypothetical protein
MTFNSNSKTKQIIISLSLFCFIVYAISPLSYPGSFNNAEQTSYVQQNSKISFKNIRIYFLNIFLSKFSSETNRDHASSRILLKKLRAILQSQADTKKIPLDILKISGYFSVFNSNPWFNKNNREDVTKPYQNFLFVFSGRSPPSL